jgi:hypothetical protein
MPDAPYDQMVRASGVTVYSCDERSDSRS